MNKWIYRGGGFTDELKKQDSLKNSSSVGLSFQGPAGGHIIAVNQVKNEQGEIIGHKIFDPNIGEYDCSGADPATNFKNTNNRIETLRQEYAKFGLGDKCVANDLEAVVKENDLHKSKSPDGVDNKDLANKDNAAEFQSNRLNNLASNGRLNSDNIKSFDSETINKQDKNGDTALHHASKAGHEKSINALAAKGADVNKVNKDGQTPSHLAASNGHTESLNALAEKGADFDKSDNNGFTPLHLAASNGHTKSVNALAEKGADVNKAAAAYGRIIPLHLAAQNGHKDVADSLLNNGADPSKKAQGKSAADLARDNNKPEMAKTLEEAQAKQEQVKGWFPDFGRGTKEKSQAPQAQVPKAQQTGQQGQAKQSIAKPQAQPQSKFNIFGKRKEEGQANQPRRNWLSYLTGEKKEQPLNTPKEVPTANHASRSNYSTPPFIPDHTPIVLSQNRKIGNYSRSSNQQSH